MTIRWLSAMASVMSAAGHLSFGSPSHNYKAGLSARSYSFCNCKPYDYSVSVYLGKNTSTQLENGSASFTGSGRVTVTSIS